MNTPAPDDRDKDQAIAEAETLVEALFEIAEKYGVPVTNNEPRWQDGVYLRAVGAFIGDIRAAVTKHGALAPAGRPGTPTAMTAPYSHLDDIAAGPTARPGVRGPAQVHPVVVPTTDIGAPAPRADDGH